MIQRKKINSKMKFMRIGNTRSHKEVAAFFVTSHTIKQGAEEEPVCLTCITDSSLLESEFSEALIVSGSRWLFFKKK